MIDQYRAADLLGISPERFRYLAEHSGVIPAPDEFLGHHPTWDRRAFEALTKPLRRRGHIYFIECGLFIKIGFSGSAQRRFRGLQTANPHPLILIHSIPGTLAREGEIAAAFDDLRHRGEWFHDALPLRTFIVKLRKRGDRVGERIREPIPEPEIVL